MFIYDVIIIGGGPAGATAAYYIRNKRVLVVDKCKFPRPKPCGGGLLNVRDWENEFENFAAIKKTLTTQVVNRGEVFINKRNFFTRDSHFFDQVDREEFDERLLGAALQKKNVEFRQFHVSNLTKRGKLFFLSNGAEVIVGRYVIGADGVNSVVSKFLGNKTLNINQVGRCVGYEINCVRTQNIAYVSLLWGSHIGYAWAFPSLRGYNLGAGYARRTKDSVDKYLDNWLQFCLQRNLIPAQHQIVRKYGGLDPFMVPKVFNSSAVALVGDALSLVYQLNGEGIYFAIKSGKIAAQSFNQTGSFEKYRFAVMPLVKKVRIVRWIPWRWLTVSVLTVAFFIMSLPIPVLRNKFHNIFGNLFLRRYGLPKNSKYKPF
jgi:flavin-dependent dehydrogenase